MHYEVVLFGSFVEGGFRKESDIDVAIITRNSNREELIELYSTLIGIVPPLYDIRVFELLPLKIHQAIIDHYYTLFGDHLEISEYFYYYRKLWDDCKYRMMENQFRHFQEKIDLMHPVQEENERRK